MSQLVETGRPAWRWLFRRTANTVSYVPQGGASAVSLLAFIRGVRADDLFAAVMQQDVAGVIDAIDFATAFPVRPRPTRYDRLRTATTSYSVEEWRGSPNDDFPVFYKLLLRGGSQ
jgi:hypothetical protein